MRPRERRDSGQGDLLRSRLDAIIDMRHPLVVLAQKVDWGFLEKTFGEAYTDGPGQPPLPTRLMAGLTILKYTHDLSDEALCERWVENPYYQFFCGEEFGRAQERDVPHGCEFAQPGTRDPGAAGQGARRQASAILCADRQVRPDQASALCPRQAVQARQSGVKDASDLSGPRHP
jgi:hypothetical protein